MKKTPKYSIGTYITDRSVKCVYRFGKIIKIIDIHNIGSLSATNFDYKISWSQFEIVKTEKPWPYWTHDEIQRKMISNGENILSFLTEDKIDFYVKNGRMIVHGRV